MESLWNRSHVPISEKDVGCIRDTWTQCGWGEEHTKLLHKIRQQRNKVAHSDYDTANFKELTEIEKKNA